MQNWNVIGLNRSSRVCKAKKYVGYIECCTNTFIRRKT